MTSILRLHFGSCPSAIGQFVGPIVIYAINRDAISQWHWSHIGNELRETKSPGWADPDTSGTIALKFFVSRIVATLVHHKPTVVFAGSLATVLRFCLASPFSPKASATLRRTASKILSADNDPFPAVAKAAPISFPVPIGSSFIYNESAKFRSDQIDEHIHEVVRSGEQIK